MDNRTRKRTAACVRCGDPITDANDSREHIIPNSIGGRLKTRGFICVDCNSLSGQAWDGALAEQLNPLCIFFGIVRERGESPAELIETTAGERLMHQSGGGFMLEKPVFQETTTEAGKQIKIIARTMDEAKKMLEGVQRKYPSVDPNSFLKDASISHSYPEGLVRIDQQIGGEVAGRSIVKTVVAIAHHAGVPIEASDIALAYLRDLNAEACFGYYYEKDLLTGRPSGIPVHCAAVSGNPKTGLLLGYVEYFGVHRAVVCLSKSYDGPRLDYAHGIDPLIGKPVELSVALPFTDEDIQAIYDYKKIPAGSMERAFSEVISTGMRRQFEREKERVISGAVKYAFANCGAKEGEILTQEQVAKLPGLLVEHMMPFIMHNAKRTTNPFPQGGTDPGSPTDAVKPKV
jgi:hypothetical protein